MDELKLNDEALGELILELGEQRNRAKSHGLIIP